MSMWARLRMDLTVPSFARRADGSSIMPEQAYLQQAAEDSRFRTELVAEVLANFLCDHRLVNVKEFSDWNRARALLRIIEACGDPLYYDLLLLWVEKNRSTVLVHNRSGILVRIALEILCAWQAANQEQIAHWQDLLFTRTHQSWVIIGYADGVQHTELREIPIPRDWKRIALRALAVSEPTFVATHLCLWPTWTDDVAFDGQLLRQLWDSPGSRQGLVQAIYNGRYGPYRDAADDAHRVLLESLSVDEKESLATELRYLHDLADPFRHPTYPPKAS